MAKQKGGNFNEEIEQQTIARAVDGDLLTRYRFGTSSSAQNLLLHSHLLFSLLLMFLARYFALGFSLLFDLPALDILHLNSTGLTYF